MSIPVLYDACVLYGNEVRDLLIRIAISGMVRAHWTDEILDETFGNLTANRPDLSPERLMVTRERVNAAVPGALVSGYETLVEALKLPDPDDRHVLAAAITAGAPAATSAGPGRDIVRSPLIGLLWRYARRWPRGVRPSGGGGSPRWRDYG